jgi:hypothetical protein
MRTKKQSVCRNRVTSFSSLGDQIIWINTGVIEANQSCSLNVQAIVCSATFQGHSLPEPRGRAFNHSVAGVTEDTCCVPHQHTQHSNKKVEVDIVVPMADSH